MFDINENKTITIGGTTVAPGQQKRTAITIDRLPTGTLIDIPVYVFNGKRPGPVVLVQAGLHGDEINGIEIVRRMLAEKSFHIGAGAVLAVPILNVFGFIHFSRDVPDGKDVNRSFPGRKTGSLASRMAYHYVQAVMDQIDIALDLHTGGGQRHNFPQARYTAEDPKSKILAEVFQAPVYFASKLIKGSFRKTAFTMGTPTMVYEAGESMRFDERAIHTGIAGVHAVLQHLGMQPPAQTLHLDRVTPEHLGERRWLRAPTAGIFIPEVANGQRVTKGAVLGMVSDTYALKTQKVRAPHDARIICINHQAVVNQGDALFHIGR